MYKYIHTCIFLFIYHVCTHTHLHIYTHAYKMYIWTHAKHVWNDGAAATARAAQLDTKKLCPSPCLHHDSAPSRPHPLICTGAEPIHSVHCPRQLRPDDSLILCETLSCVLKLRLTCTQHYMARHTHAHMNETYHVKWITSCIWKSDRVYMNKSCHMC